MLLNLGGELEGYDNRDIKFNNSVYPLSDIEDNTYDEVYASHILEHFGRNEVQDVIKEWVRVLKPNRWIYIAVPDFEYIVGQIIDFAWMEAYIMGGQMDEYDYHKSIFTINRLILLMLNAGLTDIEQFESFHPDCSRLPVSLNLRGKKQDA